MQQGFRSLAAPLPAYWLRANRQWVVAGNDGLNPGALMEPLPLPA